VSTVNHGHALTPGVEMSGPLHALAALPAWQVTEIPRPRDSGHEYAMRNAGVAQRVAALASASGTTDPVAVAWVRDRAGGPVRVLAAGPGMAGGRDGGQTVLTFPAGARAAPLPAGQSMQILTTLPCWTRISGISDVLRAERSEPAAGMDAEPSLEDGLLSAWLDPFAWLLLAEPLGEAEINDLAADAAHQQLAAENYRSPRSKLAARRAGAWHEELREGITAGMWRVHMLAAASRQLLLNHTRQELRCERLQALLDGWMIRNLRARRDGQQLHRTADSFPVPDRRQFGKRVHDGAGRQASSHGRHLARSQRSRDTIGHCGLD